MLAIVGLVFFKDYAAEVLVRCSSNLCPYPHP